MRILSIIAACSVLALSATTTTTHAATDRYLSIAVSPIATGSFRDANVSLNYIDGSGKFTFSKGKFYSAEFGAVLSKNIRVGIGGIYAKAKTDQGSLRLQIPTRSGQSFTMAEAGTLEGSARIGTLLLMSHFDLPVLHDKLVLSAGGGVGIAATNYSDMVLKGPTAAQDIPIYRAGGYSFAFAYEFGAMWKFMKHIALNVKWTHVNADTPSLDTLDLRTKSGFNFALAGVTFFF